MKDKDKISDIFKRRIDEIIDNQSYNKPVRPTERHDIDESWEKISFELDIDEVWTGVSHHLNKIMPADSGSGIILKFVASVLIILTGICPVKKDPPYSRIVYSNISVLDQKYENADDSSSENLSADRVADEKSKKGISNGSRTIPDYKESSWISPKAEVRTNSLTTSVPLSISNDVVLMVLNVPGEIQSERRISITDRPEEVTINPEISASENSGKIKLPNKTGFEDRVKAGIMTASSLPLSSNGKGRFSGGYSVMCKNTWLLNHETFDGLKSESLNTTEIVIFPDVGLSLLYSVNKKLLLQSDGFFYSNTGQKYFEYISGHYSRKEIVLKYSTIALSAKYRFILNGGLIPRSSINLIAGGYLSALHHADQKINSDLEHVGSQYIRYDLGVRLGSEIELPLNNDLSLAPGIFLSYGIPNIYKGDGYIPGYLRRTHNAGAELHLTFYYHFY